jgi:hypothetical protein
LRFPSSMRLAPVFAVGLFLMTSRTHQRESPLPPRSYGEQLEDELSLVQIEQMRVISPDSRTAARLSYREERLKYALLGNQR